MSYLLEVIFSKSIVRLFCCLEPGFSKKMSATLCVSLVLMLTACAGRSGEAAWPDGAKQWYERGQISYQEGQIEDAELASQNALKIYPQEAKVRYLAAQVAMAQLQFTDALKYLDALMTSDAAALRARCYWYLGQMEQAADELDQLALDPEFRDPWAREIGDLARSGRGRVPFETSGGLLAVVEMPHAGTTALIVPLEVNGEPALAVVATDSAETVIDSKTGAGSWVSLRFGGRVEVADVPAVGRDLAGISKQIGAPVKLLIGVHLLRHLYPTIDFAGHQFVVRTFEPPAPPEATTVTPSYYRGGAMVMNARFGGEQASPNASLYVNTSMRFPLALDEKGWLKAGQKHEELSAIPGARGLSQGIVGELQLGAYRVNNIPAVFGVSIAELEKRLGVQLDGAAGSGLLSTYRMTLIGKGRTLWLEDFPSAALQASVPSSPRAQEKLQGSTLTAPALMPTPVTVPLAR